MSGPVDLTPGARHRPTHELLDRAPRRRHSVSRIAQLALKTAPFAVGGTVLVVQQVQPAYLGWALMAPFGLALVVGGYWGLTLRDATLRMKDWRKDHEWRKQVPVERASTLRDAVLALSEFPVPRAGPLQATWSCASLARAERVALRLRCVHERTRSKKEYSVTQNDGAQTVSSTTRYSRQVWRLWQTEAEVDAPASTAFTFSLPLPGKLGVDADSGTHLRGLDPHWWELEVELDGPDGMFAAHLLPVYGKPPARRLTPQAQSQGAASAEPIGRCPRCVTIQLVDDRCPQCDGRLATADEVEALFRDHLKISRAAFAELVEATGTNAAPCAGCGRPTRSASVKGAAVEPCLACGRMWLDAGELQQMQAAAAGVER